MMTASDNDIGTGHYTALQDVRVGLVECRGDAYWRVFGPYPRTEAVPLREQWNRSALQQALSEGPAAVVSGWRYELMEDLDRRLEVLEASAFREGRELSEVFHEVMKNLAWETGPVYVVRPAEPGPDEPIAETLFGPVPRRMALHATLFRSGYLAYQAERAKDDVLVEPPSAVRDLVRMRASQWHGVTGVLPAIPPTFEWLEGAHVFFTNPRPGRE